MSDQQAYPAEKARQGEVSGRVILVLLTSLGLALLAMVALLAYFYAANSPYVI